MSPWHHQPLVRLAVGAVVGAICAVLLVPLFGVAAAVVAGWGVAALVYAVWMLLVAWPMDPEQTRTHAQREDPGRSLARAVATIGSLVSLVGVVLVVGQSRGSAGSTTDALAAIAVLSVVASWLLIHTDYMMRYAKVYYAKPIGGIDFNTKEEPQYTDFAYFSVGLGMTYQVADTNVCTKELRKIVIGQTLLAYLFATVIIATVVNLVTSLG
ncbi:DUF1345 domain-containing protein [Microbacterium gorillae]|uniref:DUF1345 domain-containing protein n=1 Tax=Microbacterium gorillae TaxID=1231063 RepID=UPI00058D23C1|nr:DUF1345 domain-containing protein [Microbacterium gorillae]